MTIHVLRCPPPPWLGLALEEFEAQFRYPLGTDASFSISHGRDYLTFFSAMGDARVLVAEHEGRVLATVAAVLRPLRFPAGLPQAAAYLGDLKVAPAARGGTLLWRVFGALLKELMLPNLRCAYGIVMGGTSSTPSNYTGRWGIPAFSPVAQLSILRISTQAGEDCADLLEVSHRELEAIHQELAPVGFLPLGGDPAMRSQRSPVAVTCTRGRACGRLEDTRRGKRLWLEPGQELRAAHLSQLAWKAPEDGARLILQASRWCAGWGLPTMFVSLPASAASTLLPLLSALTVQPAPATVFGCGIPLAGDWWVDSAEI